ncbi:MAG: hypothetical protein ABH952_07450 [Candidatus Omnitrophota bacterium]
MAKITLEIDSRQVEALVEKLPTDEKIHLVQRLEEETWPDRIKQIVSNIRRRAKKNPISEEEITRICEDVRQELYEEKVKSGC